MTEARGHHYVSQCYLTRFTHNGSKNSKLFVLDLVSGSRSASAPKNVAKQRDFNTIEGRPADELENRLAGFETKVNKALEVVERSRTMEDPNAWVYVKNLAAMFAVRNLRQHWSMQRFQAHVTKVMMSMVLSSRRMRESQMKKARASGHLPPESKAMNFRSCAPESLMHHLEAPRPPRVSHSKKRQTRPRQSKHVNNRYDHNARTLGAHRA